MTSDMPYIHIRPPTRPWFPGSRWQLGNTPRIQMVQTPDTWESEGNLTSALRRVMFQVLGERLYPAV